MMKGKNCRMTRAFRKMTALFVALAVLSGITVSLADDRNYQLIAEYSELIEFGAQYTGEYPPVSEYDGNLYSYYLFPLRTTGIPGWIILINQDPSGSDRWTEFHDASGARLFFVRHGGQETNALRLSPDTNYSVWPTITGQLPNVQPKWGFTAYYNEDPDGETREEATSVQLGEWKTASMDGNNDIDWFRFETGSGTEYEFQCSNQNIETSNGWTRVYLEIWADSGSTPSQKWSLKKGTDYTETLQLEPHTAYYVRVYGEYLSNSALAATRGTYQFKAVQCPIAVSEIQLSQTAATLTRKAGATQPALTLTAGVFPEDAENKEVTWTSSNPKIARVDSNGKVTGLKAGQVTITCEAKDGSGVKAECTVTVKDQKVSKITLNKKKATLKVKKTLQLKVKKIAPADALNRKVKWTSSNKKVAVVSGSGKVTAKGKGTCIITCKARDGSGEKATVKITVK